MTSDKNKKRALAMKFSYIYPFYVEKAENKGKTKEEVDLLIRWLTGYSQKQLDTHIEGEADLETFINESPELNPNRRLIKGLICGIRVEDMEKDAMQELRYMDKLIDELARGKKMENILRKPKE